MTNPDVSAPHHVSYNSALEMRVAHHEFRINTVETMVAEQKAEFREFMGFMRKIAFWGFSTVVVAFAIVLWEIISKVGN